VIPCLHTLTYRLILLSCEYRLCREPVCLLILSALLGQYHTYLVLNRLELIICLHKNYEGLLLLSLRVHDRDHFTIDKLRSVRDYSQSQAVFVDYEGFLKVYDDVWEFLEQSEGVLETLAEGELNFITKTIYIE
jgi:hypothetical protein